MIHFVLFVPFRGPFPRHKLYGRRFYERPAGNIYLECE